MPTAQRIAFVCPRFAEGPTVGGAETLLTNLARHAARLGNRVTFLTTCATDHFSWANAVPPGRRRVDGLDLIRFPVDTGRDLDTFFRVQDRISRSAPVTRDEELAWLANNVNSSALCEHLRNHAPAYDRILAGPYLFGLIHAAARTAPDRTLLVPCLHDEPFAYLETIREMFRSVRGCIFNSRPERDLACALYGLDPAAGPVVGMGLDPFEAEPDRFLSRAGIASPYVLYSGRREPLKGTPLLIAYLTAFRARTGRDIKLLLTGHGPVELPSELQPHVTDLGVVPESDKQDVMAGALAFCHPSVNESLGIVVLESWLAGTPALVHAGGAVLRDQCQRSNAGLWFRNYPEFEEELLLLLDDPELARSMGEAGRRYVQREYSWPAVESRLVQALEV